MLCGREQVRCSFTPLLWHRPPTFLVIVPVNVIAGGEWSCRTEKPGPCGHCDENVRAHKFPRTRAALVTLTPKAKS